MSEGKKRRGTGNPVALIVSAVLAASLFAAWLIGWLAPISAATPLLFMMTQPEICKVMIVRHGFGQGRGCRNAAGKARGNFRALCPGFQIFTKIRPVY